MAKIQTPKKPPAEAAKKAKSSAEANKTAKKPVVDEGACIGCMACVNVCPNVFQMNDNGKAEAYNPTGDTEQNIQSAIDSCPTQAISWR